MELSSVRPTRNSSAPLMADNNSKLRESFIAEHLVVQAGHGWEMCGKDGPFCGPQRIILERTVWPEFHWRNGMREFLLQVSLPLSFPFYALHPGLLQKQIWFLKVPVILVNQVVLQPLVWLLAIWFCLRHDKLKQDGMFDMEVFSLVVCVVAYRACIGFKYSFLSNAEYAEFLSAPVAVGAQWLSNMQLLGTWTMPKLEILCHEAWLAAKQLNIRIKELDVFILESQRESFHSYLEITRPDFEKFVDIKPFEQDDSEVPATQLLIAICLHSRDAAFNKVVSLCCLIGAMTRAALFGLVRTANHGSFLGGSTESAVAILLNVFLIFPFYLIILSLLTVSLIDMRFRLRGVREVSDLIRISPYKRESFPRIQMELTNNIQAWIGLRQMMHIIGSRYRTRTVVHNSVGIIVLLFLLIEAMVLFFQASDPTTLQTDSRFIQSLVDIVLLCIPLLVYIFFGHSVNQQNKHDMESLIAHRLAHRFHSVEKRQSQKRDELSQSIDQFLLQTEYDDACDDLFDTAIQTMEGMITNPLTLFGMELDTKLFTTVVTILTTLVGFMVQGVYFPTQA